jgi:Uma2 family endonuclease
MPKPRQTAASWQERRMAVEQRQRISEEAYQEFVTSHPDGQWELHDGRLVEKPGMSWEHGRVVAFLSLLLQLQLDRRELEVRINEGRVRRPTDSIYIPDILVVPVAYGDPFRDRPGILAIFSNPLPLVIEVWSRSTGDYDLETKIPAYQQRGDLEIWHVHPYEKTLTAWRRQPDGSYQKSDHRGELVESSALSGVTIDLNELFDS